MLFYAFAFLGSALASAVPACKLSPSDHNWPSVEEWGELNRTIGYALLKTHPAASSCYRGNPLDSPLSCRTVEGNWTAAALHAALPESIGSPLYANNSCLPPGADGYNATHGCHLGGYPSHIVNATSNEQIAIATRWTSQRNIRIVVKGTGHDLFGRSAGAHSLSIWTHNLKNKKLVRKWKIPGSNKTDTVLIAGSGLNYGEAVGHALNYGRVIVSGNDATVGLGGHIQGGGHGPLSSTFSLAADNIYQVRVVTTEGQILVADATQNQDLLWAIRGGGAGQYGIVTEYLIKAHAAPRVVNAGFSVSPAGNSSAAVEASFKAQAALLQDLPSLMDAGWAGAAIVSGNPKTGVTISQGIYAYNTSPSAVEKLINSTTKHLLTASGGQNSSLITIMPDEISESSYLSFFNNVNAGGSHTAGAMSMVSSRLLGRPELSDLSQEKLVGYAKRLLSKGFAVIGLQGGPGPAKVDKSMRGALLPTWRSNYLHVMSYGAKFNTALAPQDMLNDTAEQLEEGTESLWREWAPETGAYMNEGNPFNSNFKKDFYGSYYDRLLEVKNKYDPTNSLWVLSGVGSDAWDYNLNTGRLCKQ
ncbi:putative isoamyl alcohol oxidase [Fusarium oxysporum Fo47]|nr:putative isoamyl alcohol oxidase [Fusarium oxysporum Fo47]WJG35788.1 putative isoamyl alcohol oxidase [Fusarium oxysporum Fo47]